jgi:excisionase family DNA binding protein
MSERASYPEPILTTQEAADVLRISRRHVQWLIKTHRLNAVRIGRSYRVRGQHLQQFLDAHETIPEACAV